MSISALMGGVRSRRTCSFRWYVGVVLLASIAIAVNQAAAQQQSTRDSARADSARRLPEVRVVVESSTRPEAASAVVASPAAIRSTPATNVWDIVRQTAGVEVHQQGQGPGFASNAVMRGFTSDHSTDVALFVDGVPINQPVSMHAEGYADWGVILPEAVSAIRVVKGPASPFAGNFAMGGEVDVLTVPVTSGTQWTARTGSYGDARVSVMTGAVTAAGGYVAAGDAQREDGWRANSRSETTHLFANRLWGGGSGNAKTYSLGASLYGARWDSPGFLTIDNFTRGALRESADPTDGGNLANGMVRATMTDSVAGGALESLLFVRAGNWLLYLNIPPEGGIGEGAASQTEERDRRADAGGHTRYSRAVGFGDVVAGVDYQLASAAYERYFTTRRARDSVFTRLDAKFALVAPTVSGHWNIGPAIVVGAGGRLDNLFYRSQDRATGAEASASHSVLSPKLSVLYIVRPRLSAYASFNTGFRAADGTMARPSLEPLSERAAEVGLRTTGTRYEGSVALFNIDVRNEQTFNPVTLEASAQGRSRRRGVEVDARLGVLPAAAVFTHATITDARFVSLISEEGKDLAGLPVFGVSRSNVEGGIDFGRRAVSGSLWAAYTGPFTPVGEPDMRTSAFTLVHVRAIAAVSGPWSVSFGVQNIFDKRYAEVRASGFVSPGQPRTLLMTLRHEK